jgi:hypothetical protein
MSSTLLLQIYVLLTVFLVGVIATVAARFAWAHFHPPVEEKKPLPGDLGIHLAPDIRHELIHTAEAKFQATVEASVKQLQDELETSSSQINDHLRKLGTAVVTDEMERFKTLMDELKKQTETTVLGGQSELAQHQTELRAQLDAKQKEQEAKLIEEIANEKKLILAQIDTKLSDAVASFLIETLQHNVDLGAQSEYLTAMLEEHKADFAKRVTDET